MEKGQYVRANDISSEAIADDNVQQPGGKKKRRFGKEREREIC